MLLEFVVFRYYWFEFGLVVINCGLLWLIILGFILIVDWLLSFGGCV